MIPPLSFDFVQLCVSEYQQNTSEATSSTAVTSPLNAFIKKLFDHPVRAEARAIIDENVPLAAALTLHDAWASALDREVTVISQLSESLPCRAEVNVLATEIYQLIVYSEAYHHLLSRSKVMDLYINSDVNPYHFQHIERIFKESIGKALKLSVLLTKQGDSSKTASHTLNATSMSAQKEENTQSNTSPRLRELIEATDRLTRLTVFGTSQLTIADEASKFAIIQGHGIQSPMFKLRWKDITQNAARNLSPTEVIQHLQARIKFLKKLQNITSALIGIPLTQPGEVCQLAYQKACEGNLDGRELDQIYLEYLKNTMDDWETALDSNKREIVRYGKTKFTKHSSEATRLIHNAIARENLEQAARQISDNFGIIRNQVLHNRFTYIEDPQILEHKLNEIKKILRRLEKYRPLVPKPQQNKTDGRLHLQVWEQASYEMIKAINEVHKDSAQTLCQRFEKFGALYESVKSANIVGSDDRNELENMYIAMRVGFIDHFIVHLENHTNDWMACSVKHQEEIIQILASLPELQTPATYTQIYQFVEMFFQRYENELKRLQLCDMIYSLAEDSLSGPLTDYTSFQTRIFSLFEPETLKKGVATRVVELEAMKKFKTESPTQNQDKAKVPCSVPDPNYREDRANQSFSSSTSTQTEKKVVESKPQHTEPTQTQKVKQKTRGVPNLHLKQNTEQAPHAAFQINSEQEVFYTIENDTDDGEIDTSGVWLRLKSREMLVLLNDLGWKKDRQTGSHAIYKKEGASTLITVPLHGGGKIISKGTLQQILKIMKKEHEELRLSLSQ